MSIKKNIFAPLASGLGATRRAAMLLLVMMLTTATAWAQTTITPTTPSQDADGYYLIGNAAELYGFAELVNNGNATANAKLTADITVNENVLDANGEANTGNFVQWTPIGNDGNSTTYSGTFDGQGHTISGLYVSGSGWYVGFIGKVSGSAVVKNLGIVDSYFSSSNNFLGSIVGGVSYNSSVTLANVYSTSTVKGDNWIGGLAGGGDGSFSFVNSYFAGKTSAGWSYGAHHDDLVSGSFNDFNSGTLNIVNTFVVGTSQYGTSVTAEQLSDGTVAAALHYYQDALADGSMFGINDGKTTFSGSLEGVSVTTADITLHTFDGDATAYSSKYVVGITTPLPVNVVREGYTFLGWYDNANFEGDAVTQISSSETGNKEYWAKFERSHSVTFVLNDGYIQTGEIDHYIEGETTALPTMVFKDGASFEGWYTTEDFTGDRYYSIPATATEDMTFYAKWGAEKTTFYLQQGGSPEPVNVLYEGENVVYLDKTTMDGYNVRDEYRNYWGGFSGSVNVPYTGGESTFGNGGRPFNVAQSGFYVFTLTDKGEGNWFVSVLKSMLNCDVASIPTQVYTDSAIEPAVTVKDGETTLTSGTDYEVAYSNNVNAGTATVTITGKGDYSGETAATFTIARSMTNEDITITIPEQTYMGSELTPVITVKDGETVLAENTNYTVTAPSVTVQDAGNYTYTITGAGYYAGSREVLFTIAKATPTVTTPTAVENLIYNGSAQALVNAGNTDFGTLLYSLDGQNYSADIPTATDGGTYTVYYKVDGSDNWNAVAGGTVEVNIALALADAADNSDAITAHADKTLAVTLSGCTLYKDGSWNTLCLPFDVDLTATDCPLYGATARTVTAASISGTTLNLTFGDAVNTLEAGTPYIIKWDGDGTSNIENPVFKGVTIEATKHDYDTNAESVTTDERVRFVGTYKSTAFDSEDKSILLMGGENTLYYPAEGAGIGSFRAYFKIGGDDSALLARRLTSFSIDFGEDEEEATGIVEVEANTSLSTLHSSLKDAWHTLDGRRLQGKPTQGGIYIKNGKKITVK